MTGLLTESTWIGIGEVLALIGLALLVAYIASAVLLVLRESREP